MCYYIQLRERMFQPSKKRARDLFCFHFSLDYLYDSATAVNDALLIFWIKSPIHIQFRKQRKKKKKWAFTRTFRRLCRAWHLEKCVTLSWKILFYSSDIYHNVIVAFLLLNCVIPWNCCLYYTHISREPALLYSYFVYSIHTSSSRLYTLVWRASHVR